jgi:hypothetical protein
MERGVCAGCALSNDQQTFGKATHAHSISALLILGANFTAFLCSDLESVSVTRNGQHLASRLDFSGIPPYFWFCFIQLSLCTIAP